ncbi:MAG: WYL domain-containing protein [Akkermansiaceae bacterium]|nr:WYL domain-containing protein [Akkermansiaceae bacterium]
MDRIAKCEPLPEYLPKREEFDLQTFLNQQCYDECSINVLIKVCPNIAESVQRYWGPAASNLGVESDWVLFQLSTSSLEYMAHWLIGLGNRVIVLEPTGLRKQVVATAKATWQHHQKMLSSESLLT